MPNGYAGRILHVDLSSGTLTVENPPESFYRQYLGGAAHLWGHTTSEVDELLKAELKDDKIEIAQCGPAGERLSPLASVMNMANRAAGRTGMGAVMGSKNLKAIVASSHHKRLRVADG